MACWVVGGFLDQVTKKNKPIVSKLKVTKKGNVFPPNFLFKEVQTERLV